MFKTSLHKWMLLCIICAVTTHANATNYYVDTLGGNNSNSGLSPATPWRTMAIVNVFTFSPGDSILFKRGQAWYGQLYIKSSGTALAPITVSSYGNGNKPVFDGQGLVGDVIFVKDIDYINFNDLEITNDAADTAARRAIFVQITKATGNHYHFTNLYIHHVKGLYSFYTGKNTGGIGVMGSLNTKIDDLLIENCELAYLTRTGIYTNLTNAANAGQGSRPYTNVVIRNNVIHHCDGDGVIVRYAYKPLVEHNTAYENHCGNELLVEWGAGLWCRSTDEALFQYNEVYNTRGSLDGEGFDADLDSYRTIFQYNYSHDNEGGFLLLMGSSRGTIVRFNVSVNDGKRAKGTFSFGTQAGDSVANAIVHNNTIVVDTGISIPLVEKGAETSAFYNNILYRVDTGFLCNAYNGRRPVFSNNSFTGYTSILGNNIVTAAPQLVSPFTYSTGFANTNGFKLQTSSPLYYKGLGKLNMNAAYWPSNFGGIDFWGTALDSASMDIGAFKGAPGAAPQAFTANNLAVLRAGDGINDQSATGASVYIDEYTQTGQKVNFVSMPFVSVTGGNRRLVLSSVSAFEGLSSLSPDGQYLTFAGYDANPLAAGLSTSNTSVTKRTIAIVDAAATVNTNTGTVAFSSAPVRDAITLDGTGFWMTGGGSVSYTTAAAPGTVTSLNSSSSVKIGSVNGQLYFSSTSGSYRLATLGTGMPTTAGQTATNLSGLPVTTNNAGFVFFDTDDDGTLDLLYSADGTSGVLKYYFNGSTWLAAGSFAITGFGSNALRGITGVYEVNNVVLFANTGSVLLKLVDAALPASTISITQTTLATAAPRTSFKGVTFTPGSTILARSSGTESPLKGKSFQNKALNNSSFKLFRKSDTEWQISVFTGKATPAVLLVNDMNGKGIMKRNLKLVSGANNIPLQLPSGISRGVYVAAIQLNGETLSALFIP